LIQKNEISSRFIALLLIFALLIPAAIQFSHAFEDHHHEVCTEVTTHIHPEKIDCSLCDFQFSTFNFEVQNFEPLSISRPFLKLPIQEVSSLKNTKYGHSQQRGPPSFY
jgi:hypothetical protein